MIAMFRPLHHSADVPGGRHRQSGVADLHLQAAARGRIKSIGRMLFRLIHRVEITGWENYEKAGERVVIVANHTSFLDAPILGSFLPDTPVFGINTHIAQQWWVKPAFLMFDLMPLDPTNPLAIRKLVHRVREGRKCVIFPEGRITMTGGLMKVYEGPGTIANWPMRPFCRSASTAPNIPISRG